MIIKGIFPFATLCFLTIGLNGAKEDPSSISGSSSQKQTENTGAFYAGAFGGGGGFSVSNFTQSTTKYSPPSQGGAIHVSAYGGGKTAGVGMVGVKLGYLWPEWESQSSKRNSLLNVRLAAEFEGYYLGTKISRYLNTGYATFISTYPINGGTLLGSFVCNFPKNGDLGLSLFLGAAAGTSVLTSYSATSYQIAPEEPGINHFNTKPTASAWTFAAQGKLGLSFDLLDQLKLTGEYRFLYLTPAKFTFGSTNYPNHPQTSSWTVKFGNMFVNMGDIGLTYTF